MEEFQFAVQKAARIANGGGQLFEGEILLADPRCADRKPLNHQRPIECIFLHRQKLDRAATLAQGLLLSTQGSINHPEDAQRRCVVWLRFNNSLLL
jgi:hypothetical protein